MKSKILILIASLVFSLQAFALSLQDAKSQGLVGEQINGYLGIIKNTPEVKAVVSSVNAKRKAHYEKIAKQNNIAISDVQKLAAQKAIKATKPGHYIQNTGGKWVKK